MPKTEEGEYELVLGSRQLLSIFFVVVVLLGVGFTLGYMLGRNSAPSPALAAETQTAKTEPLPPLVVDPPPSREKPSPVPESTPDSKKPDAAPAATKAPAREAAFRTGPPPLGASFIQVAAVSQKDAELEANSLVGQGFPIWVAPNEKTPELFSVLVGPFEDKAELAKAKTRLEQLGFRKAFRKEIK